MHRERKTVRVPVLLVGISLFLLGSLAGWWLRDFLPGALAPAATRAGQGLPANTWVQPAPITAGLPERRSDGAPVGGVSTFESLIQLADIQTRQGLLVAAVGTLLDASLHARDLAGQDLFQQRLATLIDMLERELTAAERFDELDRMLETITLSHPELAAYFLKLGSLRMRTGSFEAALAPLAQIQNHPQLGAQARGLMRQAERSEVYAEGGEEIPLRAAGSQFVVEARLDDGSLVSLLVDTGAAMTVIDAATLERLGYNLAGQREYFATAGGVVDAPVITLGHLSIGNAVINALAVGALALPLPAGIDGLLGMNFLRHFQFRIDQERRLLILDLPD